jgi:WD40 repeat protein
MPFEMIGVVQRPRAAGDLAAADLPVLVAQWPRHDLLQGIWPPPLQAAASLLKNVDVTSGLLEDFASIPTSKSKERILQLFEELVCAAVKDPRPSLDALFNRTALDAQEVAGNRQISTPGDMLRDFPELADIVAKEESRFISLDKMIANRPTLWARLKQNRESWFRKNLPQYFLSVSKGIPYNGARRLIHKNGQYWEDFDPLFFNEGTARSCDALAVAAGKGFVAEQRRVSRRVNPLSNLDRSIMMKVMEFLTGLTLKRSLKEGGEYDGGEGQCDRGIQYAKLSPDGKHLLCVGEYDYTMTLWDIQAGNHCCFYRAVNKKDGVNQCSFSLEGHCIISIHGYKGIVRIWDTATCLLKHILAHTGGVFCFAPDAKTFLTYDGKLWDATVAPSWDEELLGDWNVGFDPHPQLTRNLSGSDDFSEACFSPDGKLIVTCSKGTHKKLSVWCAVTAQLQCAFTVHASFNSKKEKLMFRVSPDGKVVLSWLHYYFNDWGYPGVFPVPDTEIDYAPSGLNPPMLWSLATGELVCSLKGHCRELQLGCLFSPSGSAILSASLSGSLRLWCPSSGSLLRTFDDCYLKDGRHLRLRSPLGWGGVSFSPNGNKVVIGHNDMWADFKPEGVQHCPYLTCSSCNEPKREEEFDEGGDKARVLRRTAFTAIVCKDCRPTFCCAQNAFNRRQMMPNRDLLNSTLSTPRFVLGIWDVTTGRLEQALEPTSKIRDCFFRTDGESIVSCHHDATLKIWAKGNFEIPVNAKSSSIPGYLKYMYT